MTAPKTTSVQYCTYFDYRYLARALALFMSLRRFKPGAQLHALCLDERSFEDISKLNWEGLLPIRLSEFETDNPDLLQAKRNRSLIEYYFTCTPWLIRYVLHQRSDCAALFYLDADLYFFSDPDAATQDMGDAPVYIVAHRFSEQLSNLEVFGRFNVGILGVQRSQTANECLDRWCRQCLEWCYDTLEATRFADQKYLDDWPQTVAGLGIASHRGINLAPWNTGAVRADAESGQVFVDSFPVVCFHFHGLRMHPSGLTSLTHNIYGKLPPEWRQLLYLPYLRELSKIESTIPSFEHRAALRKFAYLESEQLFFYSHGHLFALPRTLLVCGRQLARALRRLKSSLSTIKRMFVKGGLKAIARRIRRIVSPKRSHDPRGLHACLETIAGSNFRPSSPRLFDQKRKPSCVFVCTYYDAFLAGIYRSKPDLAESDYATQLRTLLAENFGDSDYYSFNLGKSGWETVDLIVNCEPLQSAWAAEHGFSGSGLDIAIAQIAALQPDVVYCHDLPLMHKQFLQAIRPHTKLIVGQHASPLNTQHVPLDAYDILITSLPKLAEFLQGLGLVAYYVPLAFEERLLQHLPSRPYSERSVTASFVGTLFSPAHQLRAKFIELMAGKSSVQFWGTGIEKFPPSSAVHRAYRGEAWGEQMFRIFGDSKITVNIHSEVWIEHPTAKRRFNATEEAANNMRLFEATGMGALLITDSRANLHTLFADGTEIVTYRSPEECLSLIEHYRTHPAEAERIAADGRKRTLSDHTYALRMKKTGEYLERHLLWRQIGDAAMSQPVDYEISSDYVPLDTSARPALEDAWKDTQLPVRQRALVQQELAQMYLGKSIAPYRTLARAVDGLLFPGQPLLEIGCASGYYYEVLEYLLRMSIDYTGVDFSPGMIEMAREYYPAAKFFVADGANLTLFTAEQFPVVISSCIILHCPNYIEHLAETARVCSGHVILHRTPVCRKEPTQMFRKLAYGVEVVELLFNEQALLGELLNLGLEVLETIVVNEDPGADRFTITYVLRKQNAAEPGA